MARALSYTTTYSPQAEKKKQIGFASKSFCNRLKIPSWQEADHLAIYKHNRGVEPGSIEKTNPAKWSERRDFNSRPPNVNFAALITLPHWLQMFVLQL